MILFIGRLFLIPCFHCILWFLICFLSRVLLTIVSSWWNNSCSGGLNIGVSDFEFFTFFYFMSFGTIQFQCNFSPTHIPLDSNLHDFVIAKIQQPTYQNHFSFAVANSSKFQECYISFLISLQIFPGIVSGQRDIFLVNKQHPSFGPFLRNFLIFEALFGGIEGLYHYSHNTSNSVSLFRCGSFLLNNSLNVQIDYLLQIFLLHNIDNTFDFNLNIMY